MLKRCFNLTISIFILTCVFVFFLLQVFPGVGSNFYMDTFYLGEGPWILLTTNITHLTSEHLTNNLSLIFLAGIFISALTKDSDRKSLHIILGSGLFSGITQAIFIPGISNGASAVGCALVIFASGKIFDVIFIEKKGWLVSLLFFLLFVFCWQNFYQHLSIERRG